MSSLPRGRAAATTVAASLAFLCSLSIGVAGASAFTVHVDMTQDSVANDQVCSLREAINWTNGSGSHDGCTSTPDPVGSNVISLDTAPSGGVAQYSIATIGPEDANVTGDFDINASVSIVGGGAANTWINGGMLDRVFQIKDGTTVSLSGVTILGGKAPNGSGAGAGGAHGGGILNAGTLTLTDCVVRDNTSGSGANGAAGSKGGDGGWGGGIASISGQTTTAALALVNTNVTGNTTGAGGNGGGATNAPNATGGTGGNGGGVAAVGPLTSTNSTVSGNAASPGGAGGAANGSAATAGNGGDGGTGGGVLEFGTSATDTLAIDGTTVTGNTGGAGGTGGAITGSGSAGSGGHGGSAGGVFAVHDGPHTITSSSVLTNTAGDGGTGGAAAAGLAGPGGDGGLAGGVGNGGSGTLTVTGTTIAENSAGQGGQTGATGDSTKAGQGGDAGGLYSAGGAAHISASTLSGNKAGGGALAHFDPAPRGGHGGGIYTVNSTLDVANSTLSGNSAGPGGDSGSGLVPGGSGGSGGGVFVGSNTVSIASSTLAFNSVGTGGAGAHPGPGGFGGAISGASTLQDSLLASNGASGCSGAVADGGHNLDFPASGCPGVNGDPKLGPLQANGGATKTHGLGAGSAARDQVPSAGAGCPATDQRGIARPLGPACDMGAFEADPIPILGGGPPPALDKTPPGVTLYGMASKTIRALTHGASIARVTRGTKVSYTLTEAGTATFTVQRVLPGRKVKVKKRTRCVAPTKKNRKARACTRLSTVGSFSRASSKGANSFTFTGRVNNRALKLGSYRLVLVVKDAAGNASAPKTVSFKVVK